MLSALSIGDLVFYVLGLAAFLGAVGVIVSQNPIFAAFYLAVSMVSVAGLFVLLDAFFIAGVQLIVYAGAVMVLFVMVLMLFDLKHEMKTYSKGLIANAFKLATTGVIFGMFIVFIWYTFSTEPAFKPLASDPVKTVVATKALANSLFTEYLFGFEAIGALLLMIAVGTVTLSKISGGTHAD